MPQKSKGPYNSNELGASKFQRPSINEPQNEQVAGFDAKIHMPPDTECLPIYINVFTHLYQCIYINVRSKNQHALKYHFFLNKRAGGLEEGAASWL